MYFWVWTLFYEKEWFYLKNKEEKEERNKIVALVTQITDFFLLFVK